MSLFEPTSESPHHKAHTHDGKTDTQQHDTRHTPHALARIHKSLGNQAIQRMLKTRGEHQANPGRFCATLLNAPPGRIQPRLKVGSPGDKYEMEADRVADRVMGMESPTIERAAPPSVQRLCPNKDEEAEDTLCDSGVSANIQRMKQGGQPLSPSARQFFEPRFGQDFGHVRIHTCPQAARTASSLNARAFTHGQHVTFAQGEYSPDTHQGKALIAHELTHVIQQSGNRTLTETSDQTDGACSLTPARSLRLKNNSAGPVQVDEAGPEAPDISRWTRIGEERYTACTDPPYYWPQVCNNQANRSLGTLPVMTGTEEEWRQVLSSNTHEGQKRKRLFLRAIFVNDRAFPSYAARNWRLLVNFMYAPHDLRVERDLSRTPTHNEKMAFARALFLRGGAQLSEWPNEWQLLARFTRAFQHRVVEERARAGHIYSRGEAGRVIPQNPRTQFFNMAAEPVGLAMLSNGQATLMRGLHLYINNYGQNLRERQNANRIIQSAGNIMRQSAESIDRLNRQEKQDLERSMNMLVDIIPLPGDAAVVAVIKTLFKGTVTPSVGNAFASSEDAASNRMHTIQDGTINFLEGYNYASAGHPGAAGQSLKEHLQTLVRSLLQ